MEEYTRLIVEGETAHVYSIQMDSLNVPDHWMSLFFRAQAYLQLQMNEEALKCYEKLSNLAFEKSSYLKAQIALALHNLRREWNDTHMSDL